MSDTLADRTGRLGTQDIGAIPSSEADVSGIVGFLVHGINAVKNALADLRMKLINAVAAYATTPVRAGVVILGALAGMIALNVIYGILKENATFAAVITFISSIGTTLAALANFFQVDVLITLVQLGYSILPEFHKNLAAIYEALGSLSEEIGKGVSFIMVFTETSRSLLHTAHALTKNGWLLSELEFAQGMSTWLGGIKDKLNSYMRDPSQIFADIQEAIVSSSNEIIGEQLTGIWAAIDFAKDGVKKTGDEIISLLNDLDRIQKDAPEEIQKAIAVWYEPFRKDFDTFLAENWGPFWTATEKNFDIVTRLLSLHDVNIEEIQKRIKTPADLFRAMFALPVAESKAAVDETRATMSRILYGDFFPSADLAPRVINRIASVSAFPVREEAPQLLDYVPTSDLPVPAVPPMAAGESWYRGE